MEYVNCPYCDGEIDPSDCYDSEEVYELECKHCGKSFSLTVEYYPSYTATKRPCANGGDHEYSKYICGDPEFDYYQCKHCGSRKKVEKPLSPQE